MELSQTDYKQILDYYKISVPANKKHMKQLAEKIIADKLCKCIKNKFNTYSTSFYIWYLIC